MLRHLGIRVYYHVKDLHFLNWYLDTVLYLNSFCCRDSASCSHFWRAKAPKACCRATGAFYRHFDAPWSLETTWSAMILSRGGD